MMGVPLKDVVASMKEEDPKAEAKSVVPLKDLVAFVEKEERREKQSQYISGDTEASAKPSAHAAGKTSIRAQAGSFVSSNAAQLLLSCLMLAASSSAALLAVLPPFTTYVTVMLLKGSLTTFLSFATTFFVLEIVAQVFVQGFHFFKHPGYMIDLIVIAATVYSQSTTSSAIKSGHIHALSFLRYWRLGAVVIRVVANVEAAHESTISDLLDSRAENKKLQAQLRLAEDCRMGDVEHRLEVEALSEAYKTEVDTLMAALQIAAKDVAKNGGGVGGVADVEGTDSASATEEGVAEDMEEMTKPIESTNTDASIG